MNNKDADQPAHPRSLISVFVVHFLDSILPILGIPEISRVQLVSAAEQAGLSLTWSQTPEDRFSHDRAHVFCGDTCTLIKRTATQAKQLQLKNNLGTKGTVKYIETLQKLFVLTIPRLWF